MRRFLTPPPPADLTPRTPPTFSVIIAAYQAADTVGEAVESALAQSLPPLEVVVCDDGSTDDIEGTLEPYLDGIILLRRQHAGEASAKNAAASVARGEFVAILDADDVYMPDRVAALSELAAIRPDLDILTTDAFLEVDGDIVQQCYTESFRFEVADQRRAILERNFIFGLAAIRRERLLAVGGFHSAVVDDWDCWIRLIYSGSRAGCVDAPLARYRLRSNSLTAQRASLMASRVRTLEKTAKNPALTDDERETLIAQLGLERRRLALAEARAALLGELPSPRRRSLAVAFGHGQAAPTRLKALGAALAPGLARRRLGAAGRETTAGIRLPPG